MWRKKSSNFHENIFGNGIPITTFLSSLFTEVFSVRHAERAQSYH